MPVINKNCRFTVALFAFNFIFHISAVGIKCKIVATVLRKPISDVFQRHPNPFSKSSLAQGYDLMSLGFEMQICFYSVHTII